MKVARATARRTSMPWASREQDPRSALSPSSSHRPWHKLYSRPTITDTAVSPRSATPLPTRWGTAARPGRSGSAPSSAHPPASSWAPSRARLVSEAESWSARSTWEMETARARRTSRRSSGFRMLIDIYRPFST
ncbi:hypothetical protein VPH35_066880 [Triticum aestivum]